MAEQGIMLVKRLRVKKRRGKNILKNDRECGRRALYK